MKPFSTLDLETDPFLKGRLPVAFASGFYDGKTARVWNGPACCIDAVEAACKFPGYVYLHNGGKFDLHFLLPAILAKFDSDLVQPLCIGPRMVEIKTPTVIFRDSYALIPKPLKTFGNKKDIEIWKLENSVLWKGKNCLFSKESDFDDRRKNSSPSQYERHDDARQNLQTYARDIFEKRGDDLTKSLSPSEFDNPYPSPREFYREAIHTYLRQDCVGLYDGLKQFFDRYGINLTLASTTFKVLKKEFHFEEVKTKENYDDKFRKFYYAGRVQFFGLGKFGELDGKPNFKIYDINSAFPWAMLSKHWHGAKYVSACRPPSENFEQSFFDITCNSKGALPFRHPLTKAVEFPHTRERFFATGWEVRAGLDLGLISDIKYHAVYTPETLCDFVEYVMHFYRQKAEADKEIAWLKSNKAEISADEYESRIANANAERDFAKLFLNSAYGRFALNPREFRDVKICKRGENPDPQMPYDFELSLQPANVRRMYYEQTLTDEQTGKKVKVWFRREWSHAYDNDANGLTFWKKPTFGKKVEEKTRKKKQLVTSSEFNEKEMRFYNVCTAASITGCVRAYLQRAIAGSSGVLYCDTDSLVVRDAGDIPVGGELGSWKLEKECDAVWIGGKKLYAAHGTDGKWKKASKGVRLSAADIVSVCEGNPTAYSFDAPNYSAFSKQNFTTRTVRRDDQRKCNLKKSEDETNRKTGVVPIKRPLILTSSPSGAKETKKQTNGKRGGVLLRKTKAP